jgi:cytochrome P450
MGRSEVIWGPDAHLFRPERWIGPGKCDPTMYDMPTFQGGAPESPRVCLGQGLAIFEVKSLTAELVRRFSFTLARDEVQPPYVPGITLTVNAGLPLIAKRRPVGLRHAVSAPA